MIVTKGSGNAAETQAKGSVLSDERQWKGSGSTGKRQRLRDERQWKGRGNMRKAPLLQRDEPPAGQPRPCDRSQHRAIVRSERQRNPRSRAPWKRSERCEKRPHRGCVLTALGGLRPDTAEVLGRQWRAGGRQAVRAVCGRPPSQSSATAIYSCRRNAEEEGGLWGTLSDSLPREQLPLGGAARSPHCLRPGGNARQQEQLLPPPPMCALRLSLLSPRLLSPLLSSLSLSLPPPLLCLLCDCLTCAEQKFWVTATVVSRLRTMCHHPPGTKIVWPGHYMDKHRRRRRRRRGRVRTQL